MEIKTKSFRPKRGETERSLRLLTSGSISHARLAWSPYLVQSVFIIEESINQYFFFNSFRWIQRDYCRIWNITNCTQPIQKQNKLMEFHLGIIDNHYAFITCTQLHRHVPIYVCMCVFQLQIDLDRLTVIFWKPSCCNCEYQADQPLSKS